MFTKATFQICTYMFLFFNIDKLVHVYVFVLKGELTGSGCRLQELYSHHLPLSFQALILGNSVTISAFKHLVLLVFL